MTRSQLTPPTKATLKSKGITLEMWYNYVDMSDGKCPICEREFTSEFRPVIDHIHVKGFKKMKPEQKQKWVRGLVCRYCNQRRLPKGSATLTPTEIAWNIYNFYVDYDMRCNEE